MASLARTRLLSRKYWAVWDLSRGLLSSLLGFLSFLGRRCLFFLLACIADDTPPYVLRAGNGVLDTMMPEIFGGLDSTSLICA